jgi:hypothetical protein
VVGDTVADGAASRRDALCAATTKDLIEEALFTRRRDLFSQLHVVFFDTTSLYFHGAGGDTLGRHGQSRDHRPDLRQMIVGMVLDDEGRPICTELWPGNTSDVTTLIPIVDRLKQTFHVEDVCVVADRGMISAKTIEALEAHGLTYILGVRMRSSKEAQAIAATDEGHYRTVFPPRETSHDPAPLRVKQVWRDDRRYIVCFNPDEATKDRHDREAIVAALEKALGQGDKSLIGNKGFRRFLKTQGTRFAIDDATITADAQYDGKWLLPTTTGLAMDLRGARVQTSLHGGSDLPLDEVAPRDPPDLPPEGRDDSRPCLLLVPGPGAAAGTGTPTRAARLDARVGRHHPRSGSPTGNDPHRRRQGLRDPESDQGHAREGVPGHRRRDSSSRPARLRAPVASGEA